MRSKVKPHRKGPKTKNPGTIEIAYRQSRLRFNSKDIRIILQEILQLLDISSKSISLVFCGNKFISKVNRKFFKKAEATDVISFPLQDISTPDYLGEIIISTEQAKKMCTLYGKKWQEEFVLYIIHGILHLLGYDDIKEKEKRVMEQKQEEILSRLLEKHKRIINRIGI